MDSANSYLDGFQNLIKGRYQAPLAQKIAPTSFVAGRVLAGALSWLSFGTTATAARDYVPIAGTVLMGFAPVSSALILNENLNAISDETITWLNSLCNPTAKQLHHLQQSLLKFKEQLENADPSVFKAFLEQDSALSSTYSNPTMQTPLLSGLINP